MVKECPIHGTYEDLMAIDARFLSWIEKNFPGRDIPAHNDEGLHKHGSSTVRYGRGAVLTVDLTNRCNMMCDPCFMDANQVGYVHELSWDEIQEVLDNAVKIKPRRQLSVQFSGGEPTMHPYFLDAIRYARKKGYNSVQAATNGIEFAKSKDFCKKAFEAGLRYAYLQFDGIGNDANSHRQVGNLFDVKLRAIENMHAAGIEIILVVTIVNSVNNDQVGSIVKFAMENPKKISFVAFQPVSFTGRDEDITPERRLRQRYTLSHLANDVSAQVGRVEPTRDWFPISLISAFSAFADLSHGPESHWGTVSCGCHPNCGVGTALMINKETKEWAPVPRFLNVPQLVEDVKKITDAARGKNFSNFMMGLALLKNYRPFEAPPSLALVDLWRKFDKSWGLTPNHVKKYGNSGPGPHLRGHQEAPRAGPVELPVHRRHVVPGPVQLRLPPHRDVHHSLRHAAGRNLLLRVQHRHRLAEDHREHVQERDRRAVVQDPRQARDLRQGPRGGPGPTTSTPWSIDAEDAARVREREHDIPMTAAEEDKIRRRKALEEAAKVRAIYEEMVLKKPQPTRGADRLRATDQGRHRPGADQNRRRCSNGKNGNGNGHSNGAAKHEEEVAAPAGD